MYSGENDVCDVILSLNSHRILTEFTYDFTYETRISHYEMTNFIYEIGISHVKSKFHMWIIEYMKFLHVKTNHKWNPYVKTYHVWNPQFISEIQYVKTTHGNHANKMVEIEDN